MTCDGCPESFVCPHCGARFNVKADRNQHVRWLHEGQEEGVMRFAEDELAAEQPPGGTYCPDCDNWVFGDFVEHRELVHPPAPRTLAVSGIDSAMRFGWDKEES